jgi:hypothetical protein
VVQRRKREKVADRKKAVWPGVKPRSPAPTFFFVSRAEAVTQVLGACSHFLLPLLPWVLHKAQWVEHTWSWWAAGPLPTLSPVPPASLAFPLAVELLGSCWLPLLASSGTGSLLAGVCWAGAAGLGRRPELPHASMQVLLLCGVVTLKYCSTHAATPAA